MKKLIAGGLMALAVGLGTAFLVIGEPQSARAEDAALNRSFVTGNPELQSIGALSFGPKGLLAIADPKGGAIVCIDTKDAKKSDSAPARIENIDAVLAAKLGSPAASIKINDMQVNPASGTVYFSVTAADQRPALMTVDSKGQPHLISLENVSYGKISLPTKDGVKLSTITDLEFAKSRVIVAAQATEQFASKIYTIPLPFEHGGKAEVFSTETFHVSHNQLETNAPIRTLTSYNDGAQDVVVGAFTCTPVVKYPIKKLEPDAKVRGTSVVELGSGNQPLDLFFYKKGADEFLLVSNNRHGVLKVTAKVFSETEKVDERALHRKRLADGVFPPLEGIEEIKALNGTLEMSPRMPDQVVVIRKTDSGLVLESLELP